MGAFRFELVRGVVAVVLSDLVLVGLAAGVEVGRDFLETAMGGSSLFEFDNHHTIP